MTPRIASQISPLPSVGERTRSTLLCPTGGEDQGEGEFAPREPLRLSIDALAASCYPQEIRLFQKS